MADTDTELEEWESLVKGARGIARWNDDGLRTIERVEGGTTFFISPERRRRNQQLVRNKADDDFTNGSFRMRQPVVSDPNSKDLATAKVPDDNELTKMLELTETNFNKKLAAINEPVTAERLYRLARSNESGAKKIRAIGDRLKTLKPDAVVVGDNVGAGAEDPNLQNSGPAANVPDVDTAPGPRQYAGVDN